jgi:glycine cleavage system aminomethyltransferase T
MSLAFLEMDPAAGNAISPVPAHALGDPGAQARAARETVAVADVSLLRKTELQGDLAHELNTALPSGGGWYCPITPTRALVIDAEPDVPAGVAALDVTGVFAALVIAGPLARETFARFCALDLREANLPVAGFRPGSVARTPGFVLRAADERFLVVFGAAYAAHVWDVAVDAATRLGGRAVGPEALDA